MKKRTVLALVLVSNFALGITIEEDSALYDAQRSASTADDAVDNGQFNAAKQNYSDCVSVLSAALAKNPALATVIGPRTQPPRTASNLQAYCQQQLAATTSAADSGGVKGKADLTALYKSLSSKFRSPSATDLKAFESCYNLAKKTVTNYPDLATTNFNDGGSGGAVTGSQLVELCASSYEKASSPSGQMRATASSDFTQLKTRLDKFLVDFKAAQNKKETTSGDTLVKYSKLRGLQAVVRKVLSGLDAE